MERRQTDRGAEGTKRSPEGGGDAEADAGIRRRTLVRSADLVLAAGPSVVEQESDTDRNFPAPDNFGWQLPPVIVDQQRESIGNDRSLHQFEAGTGVRHVTDLTLKDVVTLADVDLCAKHGASPESDTNISV